MKKKKSTNCLLYFVYVLLFSIPIISCKPTINNISKSKLKYEIYIDSVKNRYKGFEKNDIIREELNDYLKDDLKIAIDTGIFSDLPLVLDFSTKCNSNYIVKLSHSLTSSHLDNLEFDLYAITDVSTIKKLINGKKYTVKVKFNNYITFENNNDYCAQVLISPFLGVDEYDTQLGAIGVQLIEIIPFEK